MKKLIYKYNVLTELMCRFFSSRQVQIICFVLYKIVVDFIYIIYIGKTADFGIEYNILNIVSGYLFVVLLSGFLKALYQNERASSVIMIVIYMIYFIPITTYCSYGPGSSSLMFFMILYAFLLTFLEIKLPVYSIKMKDSRSMEVISKILFYLLFTGISVFTIYISYRYTGFRIIFNLNDVYQYRAEAAAYDMSRWMSYMQALSKIVIPLLILLAFVYKKKLLIIWGAVLLFLNFSFAGHKSILFMGLLLFLGVVFWKKGMSCIFVPGGIMLGVVGLLEYFFSTHSYVINWFFRRQGYSLAQLSDFYYRFFSENPTDIFRSTFLGKLGFSSPYMQPISSVIGNNYSTQTVNCNNGLLADVWAHIGTVGIIIMPVILIVCFRVFDMASFGIKTNYIVGLAAYYAVMFANTTWSTVLLTHGYLLMCIIYFFFPRNHDQGSGGET